MLVRLRKSRDEMDGLVSSPRDYPVPDLDNHFKAQIPNWSPATTRVAIAAKSLFEDWDDALVYFRHRYGTVFENCSTATWWAARVKR